MDQTKPKRVPTNSSSHRLTTRMHAVHQGRCQMGMNTIFCTEVTQGWLSVYMDDIAIHTKREEGETEQQHLECHRLYTHHMLHKLEQNDLYLKPEKCDFEQREIDYL